MNGFEFPTNIKQIGSIGEGLRIYIEDYAYSYLQQYIDTPGYETKLAFLVGRAMVIDSQTVLFISGVIQGAYTETERGMLTFTNKSFDHARKEIDRYFGGLEIVGWMQSQPGFGLRLSPNAAEYHLKTFPDKSNVCMIMDNDEKMNAFYIHNTDGTDGTKLIETKGFFIYYDKNRGMHEYMLDNKTSKIRVLSAEGKGLRMSGGGTQDTEFDGDDEDMPSGEVAVQRIRRNYSQRNSNEVKEEAKDTRKSPGLLGGGVRENTKYAGSVKTDLGVSKPRGPSPRYLPAPSQRRVVNLLMSFCAVLLVVSLVMGMGMLQSIDRIDFLEQQLTDLTSSHRSLLADFTNAARPVFAESVQSEAPEGQPAASAEDSMEPTTPPVPNVSEAVPNAGEATPAIAHDPSPGAGSSAQSPINIDEIISQLQETAAQPNEATHTPGPPFPPAAAQPPLPPIQPAEPAAQFEEVLLPDVPLEYIVESGDTLSFISRMFYGGTDRVDEIMEMNNITDPDSIRAGDTIRLPRR
ncbi:MAG: LysM peptidoglycan-binding domain-containing protein [Defluviitaleaceae bacterium]|nr:LysM peptidoglycan-binding domain-containing protein [Defluviitaleaceae bacterium]